MCGRIVVEVHVLAINKDKILLDEECSFFHVFCTVKGS